MRSELVNRVVKKLRGEKEQHKLMNNAMEDRDIQIWEDV